MSPIASQITGVLIGYSTISKLRVTGLCEVNSLVTSELPAQKPVTRKNVSIWWRQHNTDRLVVYRKLIILPHFRIAVNIENWIDEIILKYVPIYMYVST